MGCPDIPRHGDSKVEGVAPIGMTAQPHRVQDPTARVAEDVGVVGAV